jgi:hypothetical protein
LARGSIFTATACLEAADVEQLASQARERLACATMVSVIDNCFSA